MTSRPTLAPVVVFAFRRPDHLARLFESLQRCAEAPATPIYIYCDGPRTPQDVKATEQVHQAAARLTGFASITVECSSVNLGLGSSVIKGVSRVVSRHGRVIVLEDDLVVAPNFLAWMNESLDRFAADRRVGSVAGHSFLETNGDAYFLPSISTWGWATWSRAWKVFEERPDIRALKDPKVRRQFDADNSYPYSSMLLRQRLGRVDSWGVRWNWSLYRAHMLSLYPPASLVRNFGFGPGATNTTSAGRRRAPDGDWSSEIFKYRFANEAHLEIAILRRWQDAVHVGRLRMLMERLRVRLLLQAARKDLG